VRAEGYTNSTAEEGCRGERSHMVDVAFPYAAGAHLVKKIGKKKD
jgi:hypothetical protein